MEEQSTLAHAWLIGSALGLLLVLVIELGSQHTTDWLTKGVRSHVEDPRNERRPTSFVEGRPFGTLRQVGFVAGLIVGLVAQ